MTNTTLTPADLRYAATTRCDCGLGMAYRAECDLRNPDHTQWECSGVLLGTADTAVLHTPPMPFAFWEVKSEDQPSANGRTTRPPETDDERKARTRNATMRRLRAIADSAAKAHKQSLADRDAAILAAMRASDAGEVTPSDIESLVMELYDIGRAPQTTEAQT